MNPAPPVIRTAIVARSIDDAFRIFTEEIGSWWPLPTHSVNHERAGGVHFVDGQLVEQATDGTTTVWGDVLEWEPPVRLVITWHPGSELGAAGRVEVTFRGHDAGTVVQVRHDGWEAFGDDALRRRRAYTGPTAWGHVLDHFADGAELPADPLDLARLETAYDAFFAAASSDGFGPPASGEWTAEQVIAHVALNDLAMTAVTHALLTGRPAVFDNRDGQDLVNLDRVVAAFGDTAELVAFGRRCAAQFVGALRRLDPDTRSAPVPCRIDHDGTTAHDDTFEWAHLAVDLQSERHLPGHTAQLDALRR